MGTAERVGVYPGTFNPPTPAHFEIAAAARRQHGLDRIDLAVSRVALGKEDLERPLFEHRVAVLRTDAAAHEGLRVLVTDDRLIVDIARGYDVVIMGADKWAQVNDSDWYESPAERDRAVAGLPDLAIAPRPGYRVPARYLLDVPDELAQVSSTAARSGRRDLMSPAAARFDEETGAWTDPDRYERWLRGQC
jgi:nicotinic acid mononucleotide adenylyltransferase